MADKDVMKAIEEHVNDRAQHALDTFINSTISDNGETGEMIDKLRSLAASAFVNALHTLADSFRAEADLWTQSRRKGWQSTATRLREVAASIGETAVRMDKLTAEQPARPSVEISHATNGAIGYVEPSESLAYLRGDTDVIPASPMPGADLSQQASADAGGTHPDIHEEARAMTQTFPIGQADADPFSDPKSPAFNGARYVPVGGRPLSFADLLTPPAAHLVPDHWSWSQLETSETCGLKYRMSRVENLTQIPQWANIGGDAFHRATELFDRQHHDGTRSYDPADVGAVWEIIFAEAITAVASTSPVPIDRWRVSNGGKENQDWWRVEGERMLTTFVEQRAKLAASANPRKLAILPHSLGSLHGADDRNHALAVEWPFAITVDGPMGQLPFSGVVDRVWECADGTLLVEDLKSGSRMPKDTAQLGSYAWGVMTTLFDWSQREYKTTLPHVMGTFYDARKGVWTSTVDLLAAHPWTELVYRLHSAEAKRRAGLYTPHVSDFCVACPVQYACPLRNRSTGDSGQPGSAS